MATIEIPEGLSNLFRAILRARTEREAQPAEHVACTCPVCCVKDYQTPTAPTGDHLLVSLIGALKETHDAAKRRLDKAGEASLDLLMNPLSPEAEDVMHQFSVDTIAAAVRAEHALDALLPEDKRLPPKLLHEMPTLQKARDVLTAGRAAFQAKLDERKRTDQAKKDAEAAVAEAMQAVGGK